MAATGSYGQFLNALGQRESSGNYAAVNQFGYLGKYQFGELALIDAGYYTADGTSANDWKAASWTGKDGVHSKADFLANHTAQEHAIRAYMSLQWSYLGSVQKYEGQVIGGVALTVSGLLAGAHLVGAGAVASFLASGGTTVPKDGNGVAVTSYIKQFAGYLTPFSADHSGGDAIAGGPGRDVLRGYGGDDVLRGKTGNDALLGGAAHDVLLGGGGRDILNGGPGQDVLNGGLGADSYRFTAALTAANRDKVVGFVPADDTFQLDDRVFTALKPGALPKGAFFRGAAAHDHNDRVGYDPATGALIYDKNGSAAGGASVFAIANTHLAITHADFFVF